MDGTGAQPDARFGVAVRDDVVRLTWAHGVRIDADAARQSVGAVAALIGGGHAPLYVDMTGTSIITRDGRKVFSEPMPSVTRLALVGRSAVDRVVANFALGVSGTPMPTRYFTSESAATDWLHEARPVV